MGNVISFYRGQFLRYYIPRSRFQITLEETLFVLGVLVTIVVPQIVYCVIGGPISPWIFVVSAQAGVIVGLVKYMRRTAFASIVERRTAPISRDESTRRRKLS